MKELVDEFIYKNFREILNSNRINELENTAGMNGERLKKISVKSKRNFYSELATQRI